MLPICNAPQQVGAVLDSLSGYDEPAAHVRLARLHGRGKIEDYKSLCAGQRWQRAVRMLIEYNEEPLLDMDL